VKCCQAAEKAGADFVKTSTGFAILKDQDGKLLPNGATVHAVELMRKTVGDRLGVKASGGVHNWEEACAMVKAGASRIGASAGVQIVS
jgi:deoxyribose-phosphate aldolase